jgi:glycerophosphoryl diester phosphodiesterase
MHAAPMRARALALEVSVILLALAGSLMVLASPSSAATTYSSCVFAAHRGYTARYIENSMGSLKAAVSRGADYLEMDVQVTKDGYFVLMHDETINRTTNGSGRIINKTLAELRQSKLNDGQRIPRLAPVLDMAKPSTAQVLLELKWVPSSRFASFKRVVDDFGASRAVVNSFSSNVVRTFHERYPDVRTALDVNDRISVAKAQSYGGVMPDYRQSSNTWLANLKAAGVPTYLWTVDSVAGWQKYAGKVTLVLTNKAVDYGTWRSANCA